MYEYDEELEQASLCDADILGLGYDRQQADYEHELNEGIL
jgi:hypothetical protein